MAAMASSLTRSTAAPPYGPMRTDERQGMLVHMGQWFGLWTIAAKSDHYMPGEPCHGAPHELARNTDEPTQRRNVREARGHATLPEWARRTNEG